MRKRKVEKVNNSLCSDRKKRMKYSGKNFGKKKVYLQTLNIYIYANPCIEKKIPTSSTRERTSTEEKQSLILFLKKSTCTVITWALSI